MTRSDCPVIVGELTEIASSGQFKALNVSNLVVFQIDIKWKTCIINECYIIRIHFQGLSCQTCLDKILVMVAEVFQLLFFVSHLSSSLLAYRDIGSRGGWVLEDNWSHVCCSFSGDLCGDGVAASYGNQLHLPVDDLLPLHSRWIHFGYHLFTL